MTGYWLPYSSEDLTRDACERIAAELRAEGYRVQIRNRPPDNGRPFGRVYLYKERNAT